MAQTKTCVTRVLAAALAASTLVSTSVAFAQGAPGYGPYRPNDASHRRGHVWREGFCGERDSVKAPDIMTYDRKTDTETMVSQGTGAQNEVIGINRTTGSTYAVHGDLTGPDTTEYCSANGETGSAYAVNNTASGGVVVRGQDGATGRRFEVAQGPGARGPDFKSADPLSGRSVDVVTLPDGSAVLREFGPHALACTRARLGAGARVDVNNVGVGGRVDTVVSLGDC
jgi:hypothetical protein